MSFKPYAIDQGDLLGWRPCDCLDEGDPAYIVAEVVGQLDLAEFNVYADGAGQPAYAPAQMLSILLYGMIRGVFSSRALALSCRRDMGFIYLSAGSRPCFKTICNFRNNHGVAIRSLMAQVIAVLRDSGIGVAGHLVLDSTRIAANASRDGMVRAGNYDETLSTIDRYLARSDGEDQRDDDDYGDDDPNVLPAGLRNRADRAVVLKKAIEKARQDNRKAVSPVDPESEQMRISGTGQIKPGFALQTGIDTENGVITVCDASTTSDNSFVTEAVEQHEETVGEKVKMLDADSGYYSSQRLQELQARGVDTCVPDSNTAARVRRKSNRFSVDGFTPVSDSDTWLCPDGKILQRQGKHNSHGQILTIYRASAEDCRSCPSSAECLRSSDRGRRRLEISPGHLFKRANSQRFSHPDHAARYRKRGSYIERVFGHLKHNLGFRQWLHCGLEKVRTTSALIAMGHNIALLAKVKAEGC